MQVDLSQYLGQSGAPRPCLKFMHGRKCSALALYYSSLSLGVGLVQIAWQWVCSWDSPASQSVPTPSQVVYTFRRISHPMESQHLSHSHYNCCCIIYQIVMYRTVLSTDLYTNAKFLFQFYLKKCDPSRDAWQMWNIDIIL